MKTYELLEGIGLFLMKGCILAGVAGIAFTAVGYIDECIDLHKKNFCLQAVIDHLEKENNGIKEELKSMKDKVVETITEVKESVEA